MLLPIVALEVLVQPILLASFQRRSALWTQYVFGTVIGAFYFFFYMVPALAFINRVTIGRLLWGILFWYVAVTCVISAGAGVMAWLD
jgi:hypothetical protein